MASPSLTTSGSLYQANSTYTCPAFHLTVTGGIGPWMLYTLNASTLPLHITDPTAAAIEYIGRKTSPGDASYSSSVTWAAGTVLDFFVVDQAGATAITKSIEVLALDTAQCKQP